MATVKIAKGTWERIGFDMLLSFVLSQYHDTDRTKISLGTEAKTLVH